MNDEEDQETPFQVLDANQLAEKTAWVRLFIREARKRGYSIDDVVALLDEPGMTVEAAVQRILSTSRPNVAHYPRLKPDFAAWLSNVAKVM